jgi:hypothetical protein
MRITTRQAALGVPAPPDPQPEPQPTPHLTSAPPKRAAAKTDPETEEQP